MSVFGSRVGSHPRDGDAFRTRPNTSKTKKESSKQSARSYIEQRMAEGLTGDELGDAVLRVFSRLENDLDRGFDGSWEIQDFLVSPSGNRVSDRAAHNTYRRHKIAQYEAEVLSRSAAPRVEATVECSESYEDFDYGRLRAFGGRDTWYPEGSSNQTEEEEGPIRFSNSGVLDTKTGSNVTYDWKYLCEIQNRKWYNKIKNSLIAKYKSLCYPLQWEDLWVEIDLVVACALPKFRRMPTATAVFRGEGQPLLSTFLWTVMENRLRNLARDARRQLPTVPLVMDGDPRGIPNEPGYDPDFPTLVTLRQALIAVPDAHLLLLRAAGYRDNEITTENIRMRRLRARTRLAEQLAGDEYSVRSPANQLQLEVAYPTQSRGKEAPPISNVDANADTDTG